MAAPKKTYFITVIPGGRPLKYREKGGGHFTNKQYALERYEHLIRTGVHARLLETDTDWKVLKEHVEVE